MINLYRSNKNRHLETGHYKKHWPVEESINTSYPEYLVVQGKPPVAEFQCGCIFEYECTRCRGCYVHDHTAIYNEKLERWQWRCRDGNIRRVILERRPEDRGRRRHEQ